MLSAALLTIGLSLAGTSAPQSATQAPAQPDSSVDRPFADLLSNLVHDVRELPSKTTLRTLAIGGGLALALHPADDNLAGWVQDQPAASYTAIGDVLGNGWTQASIAAGTYVVGLAGGDQKIRHVGADFIRGHVLTGLLTRGLKVTVGRDRPSGGDHSFPSGHTSASFLTASVVSGHYGWKGALPAYGVAGFVGWTRIRDGAHWLTDVVAGATLGEIVGRAVTATHRTRTWAVGVSPTIGGVAVYVAKIPAQREVLTGTGRGSAAAGRAEPTAVAARE